MFTQIKQFLLLTVLVALVSGCVRYVWKGDPISPPIDNEYFTAEISLASCENLGCRAFLLTVKNKSDKNIELNWDKTLYIFNGQTSGGFMFEGVVYKDRNNPKPPDIIFPGGTLSKLIWPNNKTEYFAHDWRHSPLYEGENGIYLTVAIDGKEISEKITMSLRKTQIQN